MVEVRRFIKGKREENVRRRSVVMVCFSVVVGGSGSRAFLKKAMLGLAILAIDIRISGQRIGHYFRRGRSLNSYH